MTMRKEPAMLGKRRHMKKMVNSLTRCRPATRCRSLALNLDREMAARDPVDRIQMAPNAQEARTDLDPSDLEDLAAGVAVDRGNSNGEAIMPP